MTGAPGRLRPDPRRKARFREIARGIVAKDRYNRKYGIAVDTDGVRDDPAAAFQAPEQDDAGPLEWALIPPRPRDAFWSICLYTLGRDTDLPRDGHLAPAITERGTPGWTLVAGGYSPDRVISDRSIGPLVRLGLIALAVDLPVRMIVTAHMIVTAQGKETWALFCQRGGMYPEDLTDI